METLKQDLKRPSADAKQEKIALHHGMLPWSSRQSHQLTDQGLCLPPVDPGVASDILFHPGHRPLINTPVHHTPEISTQSSPSPSMAFPETNMIMSAMNNIQERIRKVQKRQTELSLQAKKRDGSHTDLQRDEDTERPMNQQTDNKEDTSANHRQSLATHVAEESNCMTTHQRQVQMQRMLVSECADETAKTADKPSHSMSECVQLQKVEVLEQVYLRMARTQNYTEMKIKELELKLQEEKHQRKLVQEKANQLQASLEANRILLHSVSPHWSCKQSPERFSSKSSLPRWSSHKLPHDSLNYKDVPFVVGKAVGCSHSVQANVQSLLLLLKHNTNISKTDSHRYSDKAKSSTSEKELTEILQALQEEMQLMSLQHNELTRQLECAVSVEEQRKIHREMERLLLKMESKEDQIGKLYKHITQIKRGSKEGRKETCQSEMRVITAHSNRGHSAAAVRPGERSRENLKLLRELKTLQKLLQA